jgi:AbrB family looped-hinge helix DNA binding protein
MTIETIRMSSKGQIVIPQEVRNNVNADTGTVFAVVGSNDTIILKKINIPKKEDLIKDLKKISIEARKRAQKLGIKESDIPKFADKLRGK